MDPRVARLIERFAYAKGDALLARRKGRSGPGGAAPAEVLAGWCLERSGADPVQALELARRLRLPPWQRRELLDVLGPLVTVIDLTRPLARVPMGRQRRWPAR